MRASRVLLVSILSLLGLAALPSGGPAQTTVPDACPRPGYVVFPATVPEDRNENGIVCVDPTTGDIRDDVDPPSEQHKDANGNGLVCWNPEKGVITDDRLEAGNEGDPPTAHCPPEFFLAPVQIFP